MFEIKYNKKIAEWHYNELKSICQKEIEEVCNSINGFFDKDLNCKDDASKIKACFLKVVNKNRKQNKELTMSSELKMPLITNLEKYNKLDEERIKDIYNKIEGMLEYINNNLKVILIGTPVELMEVYEHIQLKYNYEFEAGEKIFQDEKIKQEEFVFNILEKIFDYDKYADKNAYELTNLLKVNICPYCNREYIYTVQKIDNKNKTLKNIIRPDLDHYFSQKKMPLFRLSFQNLIPSGAICNRNIKGQRDLDIKKHLHPYINEEKIHFKTCMGNDLKIKYSIDASENSKAHNTADFFKLEEIYTCHEYIADKLSELMKEYSRKHIEDLMANLNTLSQQSSSIIKRGYSKKEIIDIIYSEFKIKEPDNEILGNLKNDLYKLIESFYFESKK